jgi:hypothetical protein
MDTWLDIAVKNWKGHQHTLKIDTDPDSCPICHRAIEPVDFRLDFLRDGDGTWTIERLFRCPKKDCSHLFIGRYLQSAGANNLFRLHQCVPAELHDVELAPELQTISPDFCAIYKEANKAEQLGLLLVCGPGYRKSLEFLIKDFVSTDQIDDVRKEIKEMHLMPCIKKYVSDARMKTTAERATWLGNDETHYVRKWEDNDLQDLKKLIKLTCYWIQSEHLTRAAIVEMPQGKK